MALTPMAFNPVTGLLDTAAYITGPASETDARQQVQGRLNELRDYLNSTLLVALAAVTDGASGADNTGMTAITETGAAATVQSIMEALITRLKAVTNSASGADLLGMTVITETGANATVQSVIEALITRIKAVADGASGADLVGATAITDWAGATVQAILESANAFVDTHLSNTTTAHGAVSAATASKIIIRDADGRAKVVGAGASTDIAIMSDVTGNVEDTPVVGHTTKAASGNAVATHLADNATQLALKASQVSLDTINAIVTTNTSAIATNTTAIASAISGSPKNTYATLAVLQSAHPTDDGNNYLVSANNHIYDWISGAWTDTNVSFLPSPLADSGATSVKRTNLGELGFIEVFALAPVNFDMVGRVITLQSGTRIHWRNTYYALTSLTTVTMPAGADSIALYFDTLSKVFTCRGSALIPSALETELLLAVGSSNSGRVTCNGDFTVNGNVIASGGLNLTGMSTSIIPATRRTNLGEWGIVYPTKIINFNFNTQQIIIPIGTRIFWRNQYYNLPSQVIINSLSATADVVALLFDTVTKAFSTRVTGTESAILETEILIAVYSNALQTVQCNANYTINGNTIVNGLNLTSLDSRVSTLEIPLYVQTDLSSTQDKVVDLVSNDTISFAFITDTHADGSGVGSFYEQIKNHFKSVSKMNEYGILDFICLGGDITSGTEANKNTIKTKLSELSSILNKADRPVFILKGNHDDNSYYTASPMPSNVLTNQELYNRIVRPFVNGEIHDTQSLNSLYYYKDFADKKVRVIGLNACDYPVILNGDGTLKWNGWNGWGYGTRQVQWLASEALNLQSGWKVIVLSHMPTRGTLNCYNFSPFNGDLIEGILKACHNGSSYTGTTASTYNGTNASDWAITVNIDYAVQGSRNISAFIHGHNHTDNVQKPVDLDWNYISVPNSFNSVASLTDAPSGSTVPTPRATGTDTEDCWDVITINTSTNAINCTRYGAGNDRTAS